MSFKDKMVQFFKFSQDKPFINKYTLAIIAFCIWVSFFDRYNLITQFKLSQNVKKLEQKEANFEALLKQAQEERITITKDIEKYGREKYFFHRENEEVILIQ